MHYLPKDIELKWQKIWKKNQTFKTEDYSDKPKYYVLDMFPYPSGAGLHVGHPLGYIASDIVARYKRHQGFNVLHPMGYDSFGLPAEQYAIQTGQHPAITTETNINRYREQLDKIGFSFDWSREVRTSNPDYYKWTQWIFIQLFNSWYCKETEQARPIDELIEAFEQEGNINIIAETSQTELFGFDQWNSFTEKEKSDILLKYRLTYLAEAEVNWCSELGTVLANDEVINGVSERGGYPVIRKKMTQWMMRITAYSERLLKGLDSLDWSDSLKDAQRNWIGKSKGASIQFKIQNSKLGIDVFTTRPDTIFGITYLALAPEHPLVLKITTEEYKENVLNYIESTTKRSERERMSEVKTITGTFTGAYAIHPFTNEEIPIWIGDYVLASYGTGAVMAVPAGDERDFAFAKHFNLPIKNIFNQDISENAFTEKENFKLENSDFLNGLNYQQATEKIIQEIEENDFGKGKINYRLRDAVFSRQRYWGEPIPIYYKNGIPHAIPTECLPLELPEVEKYLPTESGEPPLGRAEIWSWNESEKKVVSVKLIDEKKVFPLELNTMPGWAGSSWYFNRYMDPTNENEAFSKEKNDYWQQVDLYLGGSEHATGHLLYSRFWQKFLYDLGCVSHPEYAKKLINQGMILGNSAFPYLITLSFNENVSTDIIINFANESKNIFISKNLILNYLDGTYKDFSILDENLQKEILKKYNLIDKNINSKDLLFKCELLKLHINVQHLDIHNHVIFDKLVSDMDYRLINFEKNCIKDNSIFFEVEREVEKMSKSKYNVVNPDDICEEFGADTLRMYEMFLGPLEQSKPWNTQGISGVFGFLKKFWRLYHNNETFNISDENPTTEEFKILHQTIKKVTEDIENFSFNTSVSTFMIATNELTKLKCNKRKILEPLCVLISPYAPHIAEELWSKFGNTESISYVEYPKFDEKYLVENTKEYPVSFNGKMRFTYNLPIDLSKEEVEKIILELPKTQEQLQGKAIKNFVYVSGKIINIVS